MSNVTKVNNKVTKTTPMTSLWDFIIDFEHISDFFFNVSNVDFGKYSTGKYLIG